MAESTGSQQPEKRGKTPAPAYNPYGYSKCRVKFAEMTYRRSLKGDWSRLEDAYIPMGMDKDRMPVPWDVEQLEISGDGITVNQYGYLYRRSNDAKCGRALDEDENCWRVNFKHGYFKDIVISEGLRKRTDRDEDTKADYIQIWFRCTEALESSDATEYMPREESGQAEVEAGEEEREVE